MAGSTLSHSPRNLTPKATSLPYWPPIRNITILWIRILSKACVIVIREFYLLLLHLEERVHLAPSVISVATLLVTLAQWYGSLVQNEVDVTGRFSLEVNVRVGALGIDWRRRFDNLNIKTAGKWLEMRDEELAVSFNVRFWQHVVELGEAEGNEDTEDPCIVAEIEVEVLVYWECGSIVVERDIDLCCWVSNDVVLHASQDFLNVSCYTLEPV